jgi:mannose-6-phosphate isomerase-like protein (cupin superfamily)
LIIDKRHRSRSERIDGKQGREQIAMEFKKTRRIVTGHDANGKAVVLMDSELPPKQRSPGGNAVSMLWVTDEFPVNVDGTQDRADRAIGVPPPPGGTIFRIVDFPPTKPAEGHVDHDKVLRAMGIDPATQGYMRHANTHRTKSIDYAIVLEGEIDMLLDDTEIHVKAGDTLIQQGTNHAWVNNSGANCRIAFILIDAAYPKAWEKGWKP